MPYKGQVEDYGEMFGPKDCGPGEVVVARGLIESNFEGKIYEVIVAYCKDEDQPQPIIYTRPNPNWNQDPWEFAQGGTEQHNPETFKAIRAVLGLEFPDKPKVAIKDVLKAQNTSQKIVDELKQLNKLQKVNAEIYAKQKEDEEKAAEVVAKAMELKNKTGKPLKPGQAPELDPNPDSGGYYTATGKNYKPPKED